MGGFVHIDRAKVDRPVCYCDKRPSSWYPTQIGGKSTMGNLQRNEFTNILTIGTGQSIVEIARFRALPHSDHFKSR